MRCTEGRRAREEKEGKENSEERGVEEGKDLLHWLGDGRP